MKQIILKQTKYALGLLAALALPSCAEKKDNNANADDPAPKEEKEKKVDTPAGLTDELVVQMNVFADVMGTVKNKASAEEAVKKNQRRLRRIRGNCCTSRQVRNS